MRAAQPSSRTARPRACRNQETTTTIYAVGLLSEEDRRSAKRADAGASSTCCRGNRRCRHSFRIRVDEVHALITQQVARPTSATSTPSPTRRPRTPRPASARCAWSWPAGPSATTCGTGPATIRNKRGSEALRNARNGGHGLDRGARLPVAPLGKPLPPLANRDVLGYPCK